MNHTLTSATGAFTLAGVDAYRAFMAGLSGAPVVGDTLSYAFRPGAAVIEAIPFVETLSPTMKYSMLQADGILAGWKASAAAVGKIADGLTIADAVATMRGMQVFEGLKITDTMTGSAKYGMILAQTFKMSDALARFVGGTLADTVGISSAALPHWVYNVVSQNGLALFDVLANKLLMSVTMPEGVDLSASQLLHMAYSGMIDERFGVSAVYVSPAGTTTTWAINTRTGAVTEYQNFAFNSMAKIGRKFIGAADDGLYELDGDTDDGANIPTRMRGGQMQPGGSRFTSFKAVYLGMRTKTDAPRSTPDFVFKFIAGDGREYAYGVKPTNQQTTRIMLGKGLRARYFSWELVSLGPDFDLDTLEFIPLISQRRI